MSGLLGTPGSYKLKGGILLLDSKVGVTGRLQGSGGLSFRWVLGEKTLSDFRACFEVP